MSCIPRQILFVDQIEKHEMDEACNTYGREVHIGN